MDCLAELLIEISDVDVQRRVENLWSQASISLEEFILPIDQAFQDHRKIPSLFLQPLSAYENGNSAFYKFELFLDDENVAKQVSDLLVELDPVLAHWIIVHDFDGWGWFLGGTTDRTYFQYYDSVSASKNEYLSWIKEVPKGVHIGIFSNERANCRYRADYRVFKDFILDKDIDTFFSKLEKYKSQDNISDFILSFISPVDRKCDGEHISKLILLIQDDFERFSLMLDDTIKEAPGYIKDRDHTQHLPNKILTQGGEVLLERIDGELYAPLHEF
ncbi:MAG: hypothetical protein ACI9S6_000927 [Reinekea sp.]